MSCPDCDPIYPGAHVVDDSEYGLAFARCPRSIPNHQWKWVAIYREFPRDWYLFDNRDVAKEMVREKGVVRRAVIILTDDDQ